VLLQRLGVARQRGLELAVGAEGDRDRGRGDQRSGDAANEHGVGAERAGGTLAGEGDREHRHGCAQRVGECEQEAVEPDVAAGRDHRHRREHRAGAGDEDEAEHDAEEDAAAVVVAAPAGQELQRPRQPLAHLRYEQ
jgi:hypothetical protein